MKVKLELINMERLKAFCASALLQRAGQGGVKADTSLPPAEVASFLEQWAHRSPRGCSRLQ